MSMKPYDQNVTLAWSLFTWVSN